MVIWGFFVIEKEELMNFQLDEGCDMQSMTALCTAKYLKHHSSIKINNEEIEMELQGSYTEGGHLVVNLSAEVSSSPVKEIVIENSCFYESDPDFKNRLIMDVAHFQKSYLLDRNQSEIRLK